MESCHQKTEEKEEFYDGQDERKTYGSKRKRRCSKTPETPPPHKKTTPYEEQRIEESTNGDDDDRSAKSTDRSYNNYLDEDCFSLENFCDELLYEIFKFLDTWSLMTLMNVSERFQNFVLDKRLWEDIDLSQEPLPLGILEDMLERSHEKTHSIKLRGPSPTEHIEGEILHFNKTLRNSLTTRCTKLVTMELFGVTLDFTQLTFKDFPTSIKRLVLNNCHVRVEANKSIFTGIDTILVNLEELAIEMNSWFDPYYVMPISKLPVLRYLSLKGCSQMLEFIPYGSIAGRHGFKHLEVLDLSDTPLNDSDLQCFNAVETLKEIYLQCPKEDDSRAKQEEAKEEEAVLPSTSSATKIIVTTGSSLQVDYTSNSEEGQSTSSSSHKGNSTPSSTQQTAKDNLKNTDDSPSTSSSSTSSSSSSSGLDAESSSSSSSQSSANAVPLDTNASSSSLSVANNNDRSQFLPRPDHIIYFDIRNRASPSVLHINLRDRSNFRQLRLPGHGPQAIQQQQPQQQQSPPPAFEQMIRHNLFWDIINPLGRAAGGGGPDRLLGEENEIEYGGGNIHHNPFNLFSSRRHLQRGSISDRGVCCFGRTRQPVQHGVIWIRFNNRPSENRFERFSVRHYKCVTDVSLQHLVQCSPHLVYLDVSGTSVTLEGVSRFKEMKPECSIMAEHIYPELI